MAFGDAHVTAMLAGPMGVAVVFGAATTRGLFQETESPSEYGGLTPSPQTWDTEVMDVTERRSVVFVATADLEAGGDLAGLKEDDLLTVAGRSFVVRGFGPTEDGRLTRVRLVEAVA